MALPPAPAPDSTRSVWPRAVSFLAVFGVAATRVSPAAVSRGTPISMLLSPRRPWNGRELTRKARADLDGGKRCARASMAAMAARWKPSVTVAAVASRPRAGTRIDEYLLVEEATAAGLRINNPAGHLEAGESLVEAVAREALEETGSRFIADRLVGVYLARVERAASESDVTYLRFAFAGSAGV